ncbi:hypothetical protein [Leptothoe kymatousa]|uniref:Uncharacterized protein n=1 Tax=Leptothoe kymatousa TAU-MAC 1615 TaxID=2364775 RepID=A0ABS5Y9G9_9CYAN|nr:hypothetical protein [Leptothoe kymatousa]MBT9313600.1 hypothetical protein [Leptothoe kymatousa TAU-MAC 1615]
MAIIALKAWYLQDYEPIRDLEKRPHDLRLAKNSLLKSALRADFLDDIDDVRDADWFQRYLEGDAVEFYVEGSGTYAIANIDLISHEIYFAKADSLANLDPVIFLCYQEEYPDSSDLLQTALESYIEKFNRRSRIPVQLIESHRLSNGPVRLNSTLMRHIRRSLLFIADATPIVEIDSDLPLLVPNPAVCVELGYALAHKRPEQLIIAHHERDDLPGQFPFDIAAQHKLEFSNKSNLQKALPKLLDAKLQRFNLAA